MNYILEMGQIYLCKPYHNKIVYKTCTQNTSSFTSYTNKRIWIKHTRMAACTCVYIGRMPREMEMGWRGINKLINYSKQETGMHRTMTFVSCECTNMINPQQIGS